MKLILRIYKFAIPAVIVILTLSACSGSDKTTEKSKSGLYFDTIVTVDLYGAPSDEADAIADHCMDICSRYENLFNKNIPSSDIAKINSGSGVPVSVDHDTAELIDRSLYYCKLSNGSFDITVNPVSELWDFHEGAQTIPDKSDLMRSCDLVDYTKVVADTVNDTVTLNSPGGSVDVGAAAKGYIADRIAEYLKSTPISGAIINMGGDMRLIGTKPDNTLFSIGITDPFGSKSPSLALYLSDISVATSGLYERSFISDGRRYHHILDTKTGMSAETDIESVTVITEDSLDSDCLCTVCILYGYEKAQELIENTAGTEAIFILSDGSVKYTSGAKAFLRQ